MVNNLEIISSLLKFTNEYDFYRVEILVRRKDFKYHVHDRLLKTYFVDSIEYLREKFPEMVTIAETFGARVYISPNVLNHADLIDDVLIYAAQSRKIKHFNLSNIYATVAGRASSRDKRWVVDIDTDSIDEITSICEKITNIIPQSTDRIIAKLPTVNGVHLITRPFNSCVEGLNIHKNNLTLLYYGGHKAS